MNAAGWCVLSQCVLHFHCLARRKIQSWVLTMFPKDWLCSRKHRDPSLHSSPLRIGSAYTGKFCAHVRLYVSPLRPTPCGGTCAKQVKRGLVDQPLPAGVQQVVNRPQFVGRYSESEYRGLLPISSWRAFVGSNYSPRRQEFLEFTYLVFEKCRLIYTSCQSQLNITTSWSAI